MTDSSRTSRPFVTKLDKHLSGRLEADLIDQDFEMSMPPHTLFAGRKKGISCTLYASGKLVIQGKGAAEFIEFYLEPELLLDFSHSNPTLNLDLTPRIGIDEAGKGDFFGPLCVGGLYADEKQIPQLHKMGVRDSKSMRDDEIMRLAREIKNSFAHVVIRMNPARYNEMYAQFRNLNRLLAWGHATALQDLSQRSGCHTAIIDQFAKEHVVETALKQKNLKLDLTQRTKGEEDLVVAGASILARATFVAEIDRLSEECGMTLPKGAGAPVLKAGKVLYRKIGREALAKYAKLHFKTLDAISGTGEE